MVEVENKSAAQWYLAHVAAGREKSVSKNIKLRIKQYEVEDRVLEIFEPFRDETRMKDGVAHTVSVNVYPGYILVRMVMDDDVWRAVRYTPGVIGFVSTLENPKEGRLAPVPLEEEEVARIKRSAAEGATRMRFTYQIGDNVRIKEGPFEDFTGVVDEVNEERSTLRVLVSFLGRETPVELNFLQVEEA